MSRLRDISGATGETRVRREGCWVPALHLEISWVWWSQEGFQDNVLAPLRCTLGLGLRVTMSVTLSVAQQKYMYRKERKPCYSKCAGGGGGLRGSMLFFSRSHTSTPLQPRAAKATPSLCIPSPSPSFSLSGHKMSPRSPTRRWFSFVQVS